MFAVLRRWILWAVFFILIYRFRYRLLRRILKAEPVRRVLYVLIFGLFPDDRPGGVGGKKGFRC